MSHAAATTLGRAAEWRRMEAGSRVYGRWNERGRVLATFELAEHDLIEWHLLAALEPGVYAVVKWEQQAHPSVVRLSELNELIER